MNLGDGEVRWDERGVEIQPTVGVGVAAEVAAEAEAGNTHEVRALIIKLVKIHVGEVEVGVRQRAGIQIDDGEIIAETEVVSVMITQTKGTVTIFEGVGMDGTKVEAASEAVTVVAE